MPIPYVTLDVFTNVAFGGNPLAVVTDARGLDERTMQNIAAEFGYSETTFVLPPQDPAHTARVRIFTPTREVPFAGHPNIGTALAIAWAGACLGRPVGDMIVFEEAAGLVPIAISRDGGGPATGATLTAPQRLSIGAAIDPGIVAACCSIDTAAIDLDTHAPVIASVGLPFVIARLRDRDWLSAARPDLNAFNRFAESMASPDILIYVPGDGATIDYHCRMFGPLDGVLEDPATGSANAALVGLLAHLDPREDCTIEGRIAQGVDMGRPSMLNGHARKASGVVEDVRIGGGAVQQMSGTFHLD